MTTKRGFQSYFSFCWLKKIGMYKFSDDPIFLLEQTKYGQFLTKDKNIYEGHKKLKNIFEEQEVNITPERNTIDYQIQMYDENTKGKKQNIHSKNKDEKRCFEITKIFLLLYWHLLVFVIILTAFLIISVILYTRCQQDRSQDHKLEAREIKLDTITSNSILPTTETVTNVWWQTIRPSVPAVVTYFLARLNSYKDDEYDSTSGLDCPLTLYLIMIILSSLGLVFVIILGFGAAIFNKV